MGLPNTSKKSLFSITLVLLLLLTPLAPLHAQEDSRDLYQGGLQQSIDIDLIDLEGLREIVNLRRDPEIMRVTIEDCIRIALEQNPDILVAGEEPGKSDADIQSAKGIFDPLISTGATYSRGRQSLSSQDVAFGGVSSVESFATRGTGSLSGLLTPGTQYSLLLAWQKEETTFNRFVEEYQAGLTLTLTQPLLRGFGPKYNTLRIKQARHTREQSQYALELTVMNTVADIVRAYWDLVGAIENVKVREESLANAERLLAVNEKRFDIGTAAAIDVLQTKAQVATRQGEVLSARTQVADAEDLLKNLLQLRDGASFSSQRLVPIQAPPQAEEVLANDPPDVETLTLESIDRALANRPERFQSDLDIAIADLNIYGARRDMLPQFDLTGSYTTGGRDHKVRQVIYGIRDNADQQYSVGFQASIPIGNRPARGAYTRAKLTKRQSELQRERIIQSLMLNVRLAARQRFTTQVLVQSNQTARKLQEANVVAEEKRLNLGVTTSYRVLEVQQDLAIAQTQEIQAIINHQKANTDLKLAEGTILSWLNIEYEQPNPDAQIDYFKSLTGDIDLKEIITIKK